jgi:RNA polymerase sigma-70 factor, ECF subfamily
MPHNPKHKDFSATGASNKDEALITALKNKEEWAYGQLIEQYSEKLFRVAYRFLGKKEDAEEVVQEVLLRVVEKIDGFKSESSIYTWLYRIAVNQSLTRIRGDKVKNTIYFEEKDPSFEDGIRKRETADWSRLPDDLFIKKEFSDFLIECLEKLPEDLRAAYILKDIEGLKEEEVCETLEISKPAMKNRVHRARIILKELLERKYVS